MSVCVGQQSLETTHLGLMSSMHTVLIGLMLLGHISGAALNWQLNQESGQNVNLYWSFSCTTVCATLAMKCMLRGCVQFACHAKHRIEAWCRCDHAAACHVVWLKVCNLFTALHCPSP